MSLDVTLHFGSLTVKAWFQRLGKLGRLERVDVGSVGRAFEARLRGV